MESEVLQQDDLARLDRLDGGGARVVDAALTGHHHRPTQQFREPRADRLERERRFVPGSRRTPQMAHEHARAVPVENRADGGKRGPRSDCRR